MLMNQSFQLPHPEVGPRHGNSLLYDKCYSATDGICIYFQVILFVDMPGFFYRYVDMKKDLNDSPTS